MEGGRQNQEIVDQDFDTQINQDGDQQSSFFSQNFKNQFVTTQIQGGFDAQDCKLETKILQLQQLLHQEKSAPELLPYQHLLINQIVKFIAHQEHTTQVVVSDSDDRFFFNVHKMELERVKFMLKSYLRTRLFKIERFLLFIVEKDQASLLSESEMQYTWSLYESKKDLFGQAFLNKIPSRLNPFESENLEDRMITKPNVHEFVFVRFLKDYEVYSLNIDIEIKIQKDAIYFMPYVAAKDLCEKGEASLL